MYAAINILYRVQDSLSLQTLSFSNPLQKSTYFFKGLMQCRYYTWTDKKVETLRQRVLRISVHRNTSNIM